MSAVLVTDPCALCDLGLIDEFEMVRRLKAQRVLAAKAARRRSE